MVINILYTNRTSCKESKSVNINEFHGVTIKYEGDILFFSKIQKKKLTTEDRKHVHTFIHFEIDFVLMA